MTTTFTAGPPTPAATDRSHTGARAGRERPRWHRVVSRSGIASLAVPFVAILAVAVTTPWLPSLDLALMELRVLDVGGPHTPLVGAFSRLGFNHPGPLPYWLLAIPYRVFALAGAPSAGLLVGNIAIHAAAIAGCLLIARRRGGTTLAALVALGFALVVRGYGPGYLALPWNPDLPALAVGVAVLGTWSVLEGEVKLLPVVIGVSAFAWQSHVGYLPVTGALTAIAAGAAVVTVWSGRRHGRLGARQAWWVGVATAATAAVCIGPILFEQLTSDPGNLRLLFQSIRNPAGPAVGLRDGAAIVAGHLSPAGTWITGQDTFLPHGAFVTGGNPLWLVAPVVAVAVAGALAWRAGARDSVRLLAVCSITALAGYAAVARTTDGPYFYLFTWYRTLSMLLWVSVAWALVRAAMASGRVPVLAGARARDVAVVGAALATLAAAVTSLWSGRALHLDDEPTAASLRVLSPAVVAAAAGQPRVALSMAGGYPCAGEIGHGIGLQLIEHGIEVAVGPELSTGYGPHRVEADRGGLPRVEVVCGVFAGETAERSPVPPVATVNLLPAAEVAELRSLQAGFRSRVEAAGRHDLVPLVDTPDIVAEYRHGMVDILDGAQIDRVADIFEHGRRAGAVFYVPAG